MLINLADFERREVNPEEIRATRAFGHAHEVRSMSDKDKTVTAVINTARMDSFKSIVSPRGMDDKTIYAEFPVVKREHGSVVGRSMWRKSESDGTVWVAGTKFSDDRLGEETYSLVRDGFLNGASVGVAEIKEQHFGNSARQMFNEDYKDVGISAPEKMTWYIRDWTLGEYSHVGTPSNLDAKVLRAIDGMSEETQSFVIGSYLKSILPEINALIERARGDSGFDDILKRIEKLETAKQSAGDGARPLGERMLVPTETYARFLEWQSAKKRDASLVDAVRKRINYQKGIVE